MQKKCKTCGTLTDELAMFPGGICVECYAKSPEGRRMPTAEEVSAMWRSPRLIARSGKRA